MLGRAVHLTNIPYTAYLCEIEVAGLAVTPEQACASRPGTKLCVPTTSYRPEITCEGQNWTWV
ncbi:hypothetical protein FOA52_012651 [Chlamydomonas sp. UWO 241]|nr:hypothetical protein FOA52_012651 [Chlamydomonas sp. UWO 241]